jgi:hypothetical protein
MRLRFRHYGVAQLADALNPHDRLVARTQPARTGYDGVMSVAVRYENGVFTPLEEIVSATPGKLYRVFSEEEVLALKSDLPWLLAAKPAFEFWDNEEDSVYDRL